MLILPGIDDTNDHIAARPRGGYGARVALRLISVVARDRGGGYALAAARALPNATQAAESPKYKGSAARWGSLSPIAREPRRIRLVTRRFVD